MVRKGERKENKICVLCGPGAPYALSHLILSPNVGHPRNHTNLTEEEIASERFNHLNEVIQPRELGFELGFVEFQNSFSI